MKPRLACLLFQCLLKKLVVRLSGALHREVLMHHVGAGCSHDLSCLGRNCGHSDCPHPRPCGFCPEEYECALGGTCKHSSLHFLAVPHQHPSWSIIVIPGCRSDCRGRQCGDDGCGQPCGECPDFTVCSEETFQCGRCCNVVVSSLPPALFTPCRASLVSQRHWSLRLRHRTILLMQGPSLDRFLGDSLPWQ